MNIWKSMTFLEVLKYGKALINSIWVAKIKKIQNNDKNWSDSKIFHFLKKEELYTPEIVLWSYTAFIEVVGQQEI